MEVLAEGMVRKGVVETGTEECTAHPFGSSLDSDGGGDVRWPRR